MKLFHRPRIALTAVKVPSVYGVHTLIKASLYLFGRKLQGSIRL